MKPGMDPGGLIAGVVLWVCIVLIVINIAACSSMELRCDGECEYRSKETGTVIPVPIPARL